MVAPDDMRSQPHTGLNAGDKDDKRISMPHFRKKGVRADQLTEPGDWYTVPAGVLHNPCQCTDWRDTDGAIIGTRVCDYCWEKEHGQN